jgi:hypothetical protein
MSGDPKIPKRRRNFLDACVERRLDKENRYLPGKDERLKRLPDG